MSQTKKFIQSLVLSQLSSQLGIEARDINPDECFSRYGLDSANAAGLMAKLAVDLGRELTPTLVWTYPTPDLLARYLAGDSVEPQAACDLRTPRPSPADPIAVIGLACRFPASPNPEAFWRLLSDGLSAIREVPADRWDINAFYDPDPDTPGKINTRSCGFLDQIDQFDPLFFGISPREAIQMDPQQRLMLELSWEALEDAGLPLHALRGSRTGVFVGVIWHDYADLHRSSGAAITSHTGTGQASNIVANRVSYALGLQGPSIAIDTACSSSLVAVHLACQSLRAGESTIALAGGGSLIISPDTMVTISKFGGLAPDGRCKAFDARADGFGRGEGGGVVVLKPLSLALADGDPIYCVIRGSAVNNDGFSNGLSAPNPKAQESVLRDAYRQAGVTPNKVHYVEAHGTGTALGDPIEAKALGSVLGAERPAERPLLLGSVKTNFGHLEGAAGIAGLIKVALAIKQRLIPSSLHFEKPNPHIPFDELRLKVQQRLGPWPVPGEPALAGVSSFGWGGTNCHVVLEEVTSSRSHLLPMSAISSESLRSLAAGLLAHVTAPGFSMPLPELCSAAASHSSRHEHRLALTVCSQEELAGGLETFLAGHARQGLSRGQVPNNRPKLVFVCSPHGSQYWGMGRELLRSEPVFRSELMKCDRALSQLSGFSLIEALSADEQHTRLNDVAVVQPILFAVQVSLAALWRSWGIHPDVVVGHSLGEVAAAHIAGILRLDDAVRVIFHYSRLQARMSHQGGMAVIELPIEEVQGMLGDYGGGISVAAFNSPISTVLSGLPAALERLLSMLKLRGTYGSMIRVNVAGHSPQMDTILPELREALHGLQPGPAGVPMVSTVTGSVLDGRQLDGIYWARNLRSPVLFSQVISQLVEEGYNLFLELSPHPILSHAIQQCLTQLKQEGKVLTSLRRHEQERSAMLDTLGVLYVLGRAIDWHRLYPTDLNVIPRLPAIFAEEDKPTEEREPPRTELFPLSAHTPQALRELARETSALLTRRHDALHDLCYSASVRRSHHDSRLALMVHTRDALSQSLDAFLQGAPCPGTFSGHKSRGAPLVFVFSGQGPQWLGMGLELMEQASVFRSTLEECDEELRPHTGWSLIEELKASGSSSRLGETEIAQPALLAMQLALSNLWRSWGIVPDAVVGHSVGEVAAAHVAGALSFKDAARVILHRGRLMQQATHLGEMAAVELGLAELEGLLEQYEGRISIASINSPSSTVLAGEQEALEAVLESLERRQILCRRLQVNYAFHSHQMQPFRAPLVKELQGLRAQSSSIPIASTVTGQIGDGQDFDADYWGRNMVEPVKFAPAIDALVTAGHRVFLEISPHPVLRHAISQCLSHRGEEGTVLTSLRRGQPERAAMLASLGSLYALGSAVNWNQLYPEGGRFVRLPVYPWQRKRYWFEGVEHGLQSTPAALAQAPDLLSQWMYEIEWQPKQRSLGERQPDRLPQWLIFADRGGAGTELARLLEARGKSSVIVSAGKTFKSEGPGRFQLNPAQPDCFQQLFQEILRPDQPAWHGNVVYLWNLNAPTPEETTAASLQADAHGCGAVLHLLQALLKFGGAAAFHLWLVTRGAQPVGPAPAVAQAPLWGMGRAIALEHPELWGGLLDLDPGASDQEASSVLLEEISRPDGEDQIAVRGGRRYVARLISSKSPKEQSAGLSLEPEGAYLITGGLGSLGLRVARWMVDHGARHLVLTGRRGLSARSSLEHSLPDPDTRDRVEAIQALEASGARVLVARANVSDLAEMAVLFEKLRVSWPPLRGVIHAAGVVTNQVLADMESGSLQSVLEPKVAGAWVLHQLTREMSLDFFACFSSIASVWGSKALGHYAAANHFLDALAHYRRALGLPALSINWGPWAGGGMASQQRQSTLVRMGVEAVPPEHALECFGQMLGSDTVQATVADVNWTVFKPLYEARTRKRFLEQIAAGSERKPPPAQQAELLGRLRGCSSSERNSLLVAYMQRIVAEILDLDPSLSVEIERGFFEMGMDSLMTVELKRRLEADLGCLLPRTLAFEYPTVAALSRHLASEVVAPVSPASCPAEARKTASRAESEILESLEKLSEGQVEALLTEKLTIIEESI